MYKRILSVMLVIVMCLTLFPLTVAASVSIEATYSDGEVEVVGTGFTSGTSYIVRVVDSVNQQLKAMGQVTADGNGNISVSIITGALEELENHIVYVNHPNGTLAGSALLLASVPKYVEATYSDGVVNVVGTGFTSSTSYTVRVVDTVKLQIKAMGQAIADENGNITISITTGVLEELENYVVYVNNPNGTLSGSALISGIVLGNIEATYSDGVVTVIGEGFISGISYTVRVVDTVKLQIKAMGQAIADENGKISISITTGVLEELENYVVYVNNLDGTIVAEDSSIEEIPILYTATIQAGTGGRIITGISGSYAAGATITLEASANSGYVFSSWTSTGGGQFEDANSASTTFIMPAFDVVITANFTYVGGGGGIVIPPPTEEDKDEEKEPGDTTIESSEDGTALTATTTVKAEADDKGIAKAQITEEHITETVEKVIEEASKQEDKAKIVVEIKVEADDEIDVKGFDVELPKEGIDSLVVGNIDTLKFTTPLAEVFFDSKAISAINDSVSDSVSVSVLSVDKTDLDPGVQEAVGDRPVYDFTITSGENIISDLGGGTARISIPYTPKAGEDLNAIVVYHITDNGELVIITDCIYDAETGKLNFKLNHFSKYAVGYNKVEFTDTEGSWAKDYITYLSARSIISGDGTGRYLPSNNITRAEFTKILAGIAGIDTAQYKTSVFQDVADNAWYAPYVAWAAEKGIVKGYGDGLFGPNDYVTREQIALMITRFAAVQNYELPEIAEPIEFADSGKISSYAREAVEQVQRAGIVNGRPEGTEIVFAPQDNADRAEAAKMLGVLMQNMVR